jgi:hypothetical protein
MMQDKVQKQNKEKETGEANFEQVCIRKSFRLCLTSNLEDCVQVDIHFGRGIVVVLLNGSDPKCFLAFSPEKHH